MDIRARPTLVIGALGVVFGDIGTSPLYAMRTVLGEGDRLDQATVYGLTSLVIWALLLVVTGLYVGLMLGAQNEGEGGLLALVALIRRHRRGGALTGVAILGMAGAAMFLGDSVVTPAISVLAAAEGLEVASPSLQAAVLPVALVLLLGVFVLQRVGSGVIGRFYGPVMVVWFAVLAATGVGSLVQDLGPVAALSPVWAVRFVADDPLTGFLALGAVVLAVTGAEALYADLGHFGRRAITLAWLFPVLPALVLAYLGEAGEVLRHPHAASDPFYAVVPGWATIPVLVVATAATVIASEAVIAGAFTVLHQAGGLGLFPYLRTRHTSAQHAGQIYLPAANWTLAAAVLAVVVGFGSSDRLAAAYGVAVSATILISTVLFVWLARAQPGRGVLRQVGGAAGSLMMLCFLAATLPKVASGGWLPVTIGVLLLVLMTTWRAGERRLSVARRREELDADQLLRRMNGDQPLRRVPGAGVFLTHDSAIAPLALRTLVESGRMLPEQVVILSWRVADTPTAEAHEARVRVDDFGRRYDGVVALDVTLGYRERFAATQVLQDAREQTDAVDAVDPETAWYFVSEPRPQLTRGSPMARWRQRLFLLVDRLTTDRVEQLALPRDRTITIGRALDL